MFKFLRRLDRLAEKSPKTFEHATEEDVYYCYRLLLDREPDERGWSYWLNLVQNHSLSTQALVDGFLGGYEFQQLRAERVRPKLAELPEFKIYARGNDHFVGAVILREKQYEPHVSMALHHLLKPGDVFCDIGANIGYFSLMAAAQVGSDGQVLAFEPNPDNQNLLRMSIEANNFSNVILYPYAVSEKEGTLFFTSGGADSNGRIVTAAEQAAWQIELPQVKTVALDQLFPDLPRLDVIKMDIEGAEPLAYQGMRQLIERHRPVIILEFNPQLIKTTSGVSPAAFLADLQTIYRLRSLNQLPKQQEFPGTISEINSLIKRLSLTHLDLIAEPIYL
jgi:FkbM family methyltransferase